VIGVFGGTFDPVHFGHLRPALELFEVLRLDELRLIPAGVPPHRRAPYADPAHRLEMLRRAVAAQPGFIPDEREIRRSGPSYMVDTLTELRAELGEGRPLCLLMGMDAFLGLNGWHRWQEIPRLAHLVVSHRPGWSPEHLDDHGGPLAELAGGSLVSDPGALRDSPAGCVFMHPVTQLDISSTRIRSLIRQRRNPRYLLPEEVRAYIQEQRLYR